MHKSAHAVPAILLILILSLVLAGCSGARLSSNEARKQIAAIGTSKLVPQAIEILRIVSQSDSMAIAETTVAMTFQFKKDKASGSWSVSSMRMGDGDWLDVNELMAAVNEARKRSTIASLEKLSAAVASYRRANGTVPNARDIVGLTDALHPQYLNELIRDDAWGKPFIVEITNANGGAVRLSSNGPDGIHGTADDITLPN
jgi:hypothetical protein